MLIILCYRCIHSANNVTNNLITNQPQSIYANEHELECILFMINYT